jgi:HEAT repeats
MRKLIPLIVFAIGLVVGCYGIGGDASQAAEKKKEQKASDEELRELYKQLIKDLGSRDFKTRDMAYKQLLNSPRAVQELRRALAARDLSPEVRRRVENLLEELDVKKLLGKLEGEQEQSDAAYATLTKFGLNHGEELLRIYKTADDKSKAKLAVVFGKVRAAAIERKRIDLADDMEEALLRCLREPNHKITYPTIWALTKVGPPSKKSIPVLIEILDKKGASWEVRSAAAWGLTNHGPSASEAIPTLLKWLNAKPDRKPMSESDEKEEDRGRASICLALASVGPKDEGVYAALKKAVLDRKESTLVRGVAISCVANMGERGQVIIPELVKILKDTRGTESVPERFEEWKLGWSSVLALGKLKLSKEEISVLLQIVGDQEEDSKVRRDALAAIVHSRESAQGAWRPLLQLIQRDEQPIGGLDRIVIALREIDPPKDADRAVLARELRTAFDNILRDDSYGYLAKEMAKTVKAVEKNKRP